MVFLKFIRREINFSQFFDFVHDPDLAERLMELVVQSHYKEASGATSGGEGLRMMADVRRVLTRRDGLQRRAAAVRALFAETEKA